MEKLKVIVRLRPFSRRERATCGEEEVRVVDGMVQLGRQPGYALSEPPNSVGRQLAAPALIAFRALVHDHTLATFLILELEC